MTQSTSISRDKTHFSPQACGRFRRCYGGTVGGQAALRHSCWRLLHAAVYERVVTCPSLHRAGFAAGSGNGREETPPTRYADVVACGRSLRFAFDYYAILRSSVLCRTFATLLRCFLRNTARAAAPPAAIPLCLQHVARILPSFDVASPLRDGSNRLDCYFGIRQTSRRATCSVVRFGLTVAYAAPGFFLRG